MRHRSLFQVVLLAPAVALGTLVLGWWVVPATGAIWGLVARERERPQLVVGSAAGIGWSLLLIWTATQGPILQVARRAAGVIGMSGVWLFLATIAFPMILAWAAAVIAGAVRGRET